jgi:ribonuclease J
MPVHGEWRHLRAHARLGIESGVAPDRVVLCEDGDVVDLIEGHARIVGHVKSRYVYVDGLAVGDVSESLLTERRILGDGGFISATVVIDSVTGKVVGEPSISAKGFSEDPDAFNPVIPLLTAALHRSAEDGVTDPHQLQQVVRRTVGRWVNDAYRRRPMIVPTVVEV